MADDSEVEPIEATAPYPVGDRVDLDEAEPPKLIEPDLTGRRRLTAREANALALKWGQPFRARVTATAHELDEAVAVETTNHGILTGDVGDYLIVGVEDDAFPIPKDVFEQTWAPD